MNKELFLDTSAYLALFHSHDQYHKIAREFWRGLPPATRKITTGLIISETYSLLRQRMGYEVAIRFLRVLGESSRMGGHEIVYPEATMSIYIERVLTKYSDQSLSYADAFSLHLLHTRTDIEAAFSFDQHLALGGILVVPEFHRRRR